MKRPAVYLAIPFLLGLLTAAIIPAALWISAAGIGILPFLAGGLWNKSFRKQSLICTLSFLIACCIYWHHDDRISHTQLPLSGKETTFNGIILEKEIYSSGYASYILKGRFQNGVKASIQYFTDESYFDYGDSITLTGTVNQLESSYLFDTAGYYRGQNIFLQMSGDAESEYIPCTDPDWKCTLYRWREKIVRKLHRNMSEEGGAMLAGMLFGDKSGMTAQNREALQRAGIGHILAVSGLHLDFLALCLLRLLRRCRAGRIESFGITLGICLLFTVCTGGTVSVKRACIMLAISQGAGLFFRKADPLNSLCIAILVLCLENPFIIHSSAFWLSCSGAFGISVLAPFLTQPLPENTVFQLAVKEILKMGCVFLAIFPASALYFRKITLLSPLSNLLLVPLCMMALLFGIPAVFLPAKLAEYILAPADLLCQGVLDISGQLAKLPLSSVNASSSLLVWILVLSLGFLSIGFVMYRNRRFLTISCILMLLVSFGSAATEQKLYGEFLTIHMLGRGSDCVLVIQKNREAIIVDISGSSQNAAYARTALESSGTETISSLVFCRPKAEILKKYTEKFPDYTAEECWILQQPEEIKTPVSMGRSAAFSEQFVFSFHGAEITADTSMVRISYSGIHFACCTKDAVPPEGCDILEICGSYSGIVPECGILVLPHEESGYLPDAYTYVGENNLQLTIAGNGKYTIRRLYAGT